MAFYETYFSNASAAPHSIYTFYEVDRGSTVTRTGEFVECQTDDEKKDFAGNALHGVTHIRKQYYDFPIDTPFVKNAAVNQNYFLQDYTDNFIKIR